MESKYECPYCGKTKFTSQPGLTNHMKACTKKDRSPKVKDDKIIPSKKQITDVDLKDSRIIDKVDADVIYKKIKRQYLYDLNNSRPSGYVVVHFDYDEAKMLMSIFKEMSK